MTVNMNALSDRSVSRHLFFCLEHILLFLYFRFLSVLVSSHETKQSPLQVFIVWPHVGGELLQSAQPNLLVTSYAFVFVQAVVFIFNDSKKNKVCQDSSVSQRCERCTHAHSGSWRTFFFFSLEDFLLLKLIYNVVLISTVQQNDSVIYVTYIFF